MIARHPANKATFKVTTPSKRPIVMTRLFNAPRRLVFEAISRPQHGVEKGAAISYDRLDDLVTELQQS